MVADSHKRTNTVVRLTSERDRHVASDVKAGAPTTLQMYCTYVLYIRTPLRMVLRMVLGQHFLTGPSREQEQLLYSLPKF